MMSPTKILLEEGQLPSLFSTTMPPLWMVVESPKSKVAIILYPPMDVSTFNTNSRITTPP